MGLLNEVKEQGAAVKQVAETTNKKAERKAKAKERKAEKAAAVKRIYEYLIAHPVKELEKDVAALKPAERQATFAPGLTPEMLFGKDFKKGAKISALDVFTKHKKGYPEMRKYIKKWAEKGVNVILEAATQSYVVQ